MLQMPAKLPECVAQILLFDVGVEGIEQNPDVRIRDFVTESHAIRRGVEEESLETIQRFDPQRDTVLGEHRASRLVPFNRPLPFIRRPAPARQVADLAIERPANEIGAGIRSRFHRVLNVLPRHLPRRGILANQALAIDEQRADRTFQIVLGECVSDGRCRKFGWPEQRNLHAIETRRLDARQQRQAARAELLFPDERVDAVFHRRKSGSFTISPPCIADSCAQMPAQVQFTD